MFGEELFLPSQVSGVIVVEMISRAEIISEGVIPDPSTLQVRCFDSLEQV